MLLSRSPYSSGICTSSASKAGGQTLCSHSSFLTIISLNPSSSACEPPEQREYVEDDSNEDGLQDASPDAVEDTGPECMEDLLIGDYWLQEAEAEQSDDGLDPNILPLGVDITLVWQLPTNLQVHQCLLEDLRFYPLADFWPLSEHWAMATLIPSSGEIHLFDSFGNRNTWEAEVKDIMAFTAQLVIVANQHGHPLHVITSDWRALPTLTSNLQTNKIPRGTVQFLIELETFAEVVSLIYIIYHTIIFTPTQGHLRMWPSIPP
ncbi:hypothetical protein DXG01_000922 [Tephrocybe rancida]|nr:hypothetical protein DXG01_000922 [Tephrocybe rancida]